MKSALRLGKTRRALVTGGAGFIGSHLSRELLRHDYQVTVLDNLATGKLENIADLFGKDDLASSKEDRFKFVQGSIYDLILLQELFQGIDFVFHQAAICSVPGSIEDPVASHEANMTGTLNVLLAARDNQVRKVVFASSSSVYGDTSAISNKEDMNTNPISPYAVTKLAGEHYCHVFKELYGLSTICLRYFNVYGPGQDPNSQYATVIPLFIQRAFHSDPLIILGDGEQTRDFIFVDDVVDVNMLAAENDVTGSFNIGSGDRTTINRLAELIIELIGVETSLLYKEPRLGDVKHSFADITRAKNFGYDPKYSLQDGLKQTITSFIH